MLINDLHRPWIAFAEIKNYTSMVEVSIGKDIILRCTGFSKTKPFMISWIKNNITLNPKYNLIIQKNLTEYSAMSQLIINSTTHKVSDAYQCLVYNPYSSETSENITIIVQGKDRTVHRIR